MDERLQALQAEMEEEQTLRRKRDSLEVEYRSLCSYERELAVLRQKELEDVARMEQGGVRGTSLRKPQANMKKHWHRSRQKLLRWRQGIKRYSRKLRKWRILCGSWINASAN